MTGRIRNEAKREPFESLNAKDSSLPCLIAFDLDVMRLQDGDRLLGEETAKAKPAMVLRPKQKRDMIRGL